MSAGQTNNFTYPGPKLLLNNPTFDVNCAIENKVKRFELMDKVFDPATGENWMSIPKKIVNYKGNAAHKLIVVPYVPYDSEEQFKWFKKFQRTLYLNQQSPVFANNGTPGIKHGIPIVRPVGHDAYLQSITFAAYDFHEPLPHIDVDAIVEALNTWDGGGNTEANLVLTDGWDTGYDALIIAVAPMGYLTAEWLRSTSLTTAHYPDMVFGSTVNTHIDLMMDAVKVIERLSQGAARTNAFHGMLPSDWVMNNFNYAVGYCATGSSSPDGYIWDSRGRVNTSDTPDNLSYEEYEDGVGSVDGIGSDNIIPSLTNEVNLLIPLAADYLTLDVQGPGWFNYLEIKGYSDAVKGVNSAKQYNRTICQMPLKVLVDIRYYPQA